MSFLDLAKKRFSVRDYLETPINDAHLETVLEAGRLAPSACNNQPWIFIVIKAPETRKQLECVYNRAWFLRAPVIIAVCCDQTRVWRRADGRSSADLDIGIALDHMTLAAADIGLGTCWICNFNAPEAKKLLNLPDHIEPVAFTPLGFAGPGAVCKKSRKSLSEMLFMERWSGQEQ